MSTPTRLWAALIAAILAALAVGAAAAVTMDSRQSTATSTTATTEPLVEYIQELSRSLSDADATIATAILVGQVPPVALTKRFNTDIQQAEKYLAVAARDVAADPEASADLAKAAAALPQYTQLIGAAESDNRLGYPVGAAYLRDASTLLRGLILNAVGAALADENAAQASATYSLGGLPWALLLVALAAAAVLIWAWRTVAAATRRRVNPGLAAAALLSVGLVLWTLVAGYAAAGSARSAEGDFNHVSTLLQVRAALATAESDQSLTLVERGEDNGAYAADEARQLGAIDKSGVLDKTTEPQWTALSQSVAQVGTQVAAGDYHDAIAATAGTGAQSGKGGTLALAGTLDNSFVQETAEAQNLYTRDGRDASGDLSGGLWGALLVAVLAAAAAAYGVNRRLAEYR